MSYLIFAYVFANIAGYIFHAFVSRNFGPTLYADFSILYALMLALSRPIGAISAMVTRVAVSGKLEGKEFDEVFRFAARLGGIVALIIGLVPLAGFPIIGKVIGITGVGLYIPVGGTLFAWALLNVFRGLFASVEDFRTVSLSSILEFSLRTASAIILVVSGAGVFGALLSSAIGASAALGFCVKKMDNIRRMYAVEGAAGEWLARNSLLSSSVKVALITIPIGFFLELDVILAKRYFSPSDAGLYAAGAFLGKTLLSCSAIAGGVIYPRLVASRYGEKGIEYFMKSIAFSVFVFAVGYGGALLLGREIILLVFGGRYMGIESWIAWYIIAMFSLAIHLQVMNFQSAVGGWKDGIWLWGVLLSYWLTLEYFSSDVSGYVKAVFFYHLFLAPLSFVILNLGKKETQPNSLL
ncbi:MAG: hypothetical protein QXP38_11875 [Nitrososphaerota archaeon]